MKTEVRREVNMLGILKVGLVFRYIPPTPSLPPGVSVTISLPATVAIGGGGDSVLLVDQLVHPSVYCGGSPLRSDWGSAYYEGINDDERAIERRALVYTIRCSQGVSLKKAFNMAESCALYELTPLLTALHDRQAEADRQAKELADAMRDGNPFED